MGDICIYVVSETIDFYSDKEDIILFVTTDLQQAKNKCKKLKKLNKKMRLLPECKNCSAVHYFRHTNTILKISKTLQLNTDTDADFDSVEKEYKNTNAKKFTMVYDSEEDDLILSDSELGSRFE
jgi:hypothetical protein